MRLAARWSVALMVAASAVLSTVATPVAAVGSDTGPITRSAGATPPPRPAVLPAVPPTDPTVFASSGPFLAGVMTIDLPAGRGAPAAQAEVWYPVAPLSSRRIATETVYDLKAWLPAAQRSALGTKPGALFVTGAARDEKIAPGGPFPVVAFSHGFAGFRVDSAFLMVHLASWGFVVVAPEHRTRDLTAALEGRTSVGTADVDDIAASIRALRRSSIRKRLDLSNLAAVGHAAGADAAVRWAAGEPRVQGIVAMAGGVSGPTSRLPEPLRPILFLSAANDRTIRAQSIVDGYRSSRSPKRLIALADSGHLAFTGICTIAADRGGLMAEAGRLGAKVPATLATLGSDGCSAPDAPVGRSWPVINSSVVAELRAVFGSGTPGFGLDQTTLDILASRGSVKATFTIG